MASLEKEQLLEAGNKLLNPPTSVDELLTLLDQVEHCLSRVEQSPSKSMQNALSPSLKALVTNELLSHSNVDVKVSVASCISEITRITAPDAPYEDDQMKEVFQLIVSSFEGLSDNSSRSYSKRISILETVAKVRSCVVMLDLECDALILEMFQHFLQAIREYHPENVFSSMETIMTLVLEESEDISLELLSPILDSVKRDNKEVSPIARSLVEKVLENCAAKLRPAMILAMKSLNISLGDYSKVVAHICKDTSNAVEPNDLNVSSEHLVKESELAGTTSDEVHKESTIEATSVGEVHVVDDSKKSITRNGVVESGIGDAVADSDREEHLVVTEAGSDSLDVGKVVESDLKTEQATEERGGETDSSKNAADIEQVEQSINNGEKEPDKLPESQKSCTKEVSSSPHDDSSIEAVLPVEKKDDVCIKPSSPKAMEIDTMYVASSSPSASLPNESHSGKVGKPKEDMGQQAISSANVASKKLSEGTSDLEVKSDKSLGKKTSTVITDEDAPPVPGDGPKEEDVIAPDSEIQLIKQVETGDVNKDKSSKKKIDEKRQGRKKAITEKDSAKSSAKADDKVVVSSPKSAAKLSKDENFLEETPGINSKRKRTPGKEKASDDKGNGEDLVGSKVKVWWPKDRKFYEGIIRSFDSAKKKHKVVYTDGDEEILNLAKERWELIEGDSVSDEDEDTGASPKDETEMHQKKKARTNPTSTREGKVDASSERGTGKNSSGKSMRSGRKSRDFSNTEGSKSAGKSKAISESADDAPKMSGKSKNVEQDTPRSKQETPKSATRTKGKSPRSGTKAGANGTGKTKSGSSKVEDDEYLEEELPDLSRSLGSMKKKSPDSSKTQLTEGKTGKKRRRGVKS